MLLCFTRAYKSCQVILHGIIDKSQISDYRLKLRLRLALYIMQQ